MIDIQILRDNPELVQVKSAQKGYQIDVNQIVGFDKERLLLLNKVEELRKLTVSQQNLISNQRVTLK